MFYRFLTTIILFSAILLSKELIVLNEEILVAACFFLLVVMIFTYGKEPINAMLEERALAILKELEAYHTARRRFNLVELESLEGYHGIRENLDLTKDYCIAIAETSLTASINSVLTYLNVQTEQTLSDIEKESRAEMNKIMWVLYVYLKRTLLKKRKVSKKPQKKTQIEETRRRILARIKNTNQI